MSKLDDIKAQLLNIDDSANNIAADLQRLADRIEGGLTAAEADQVVSEITAISTKLRGIADINPEDITTTTTLNPNEGI